MSLQNRLSYGAKIDNQAIENLIKPNSLLDNAIAKSSAKGIPSIAVHPLAGQFLAIQCKLIGAKTVLEIGTLGGYSRIWFAEAGAKVTSIEIYPMHVEVSRENTKGLDVEVLVGSALDILPKLEAEGRKFDLIFIDADWERQAEYFAWEVKLARVDGCIYVDNVVRQLYEEIEEGSDGTENLLTKVGAEKKVNATLLSMVSSYRQNPEDDYDGVLLAVVNEN